MLSVFLCYNKKQVDYKLNKYNFCSEREVKQINYMGNAVWWDERFRNRPLHIMEHERRLEEDLPYFKFKKTILDAACGDGRNAVFLARLGFEVHAVDFSPEALKRLNYFSQEEKLNIQTDLVDFCEKEFDNISAKYDGIVINHYRMPQILYVKMMYSLNPEGILWVNGFRKVPEDNPNVKESDVLHDEDFEMIRCCRLIDKKEYCYNNKEFVRYIWTK